MSKPGIGGRHALLVATGQYEDKTLDSLRAPTGDVEALGQVLSDPNIGNFEPDLPVVDRTSYEVSERIERFFEGRRPGDMLLLYISCHGLLSPNRRLYFAATNTRREVLRTTAVPDSLVAELMHNTRAGRVILVLDCCHSGAFGRGVVTKGGTGVGIEHRFDHGRGRATLTASDELEYAFEADKPADLGASHRSVFTEALVTGLKTGAADINGDGHVSLDELYDYLCDEVRERNPNQTPGMSGDFRGDIFVARSRRAPRTGDLPPELDAAIASRYAGIREGAVRALVQILESGDENFGEPARRALMRLADDDTKAVSAAAGQALGQQGNEKASRRRAAPQQKSAPASPKTRQRRAAARQETPPASPIPRHDALTMAELRARLPDLTPEQLRQAKRYEKRHKHRKTVVSAIDRRLSSGGSRPKKRTPNAPPSRKLWTSELLERGEGVRVLRASLPQDDHVIRMTFGGAWDRIEVDGQQVRLKHEKSGKFPGTGNIAYSFDIVDGGRVSRATVYLRVRPVWRKARPEDPPGFIKGLMLDVDGKLLWKE
jgi:hypothetical protein